MYTCVIGFAFKCGGLLHILQHFNPIIFSLYAWIISVSSFLVIQVAKWEVIIPTVKAADARRGQAQAALPQVPTAKARKREGAAAAAATMTDIGAPMVLEEGKAKHLRNLGGGNQEETGRRKGRLSTNGDHHDRIRRMSQTVMVSLHRVVTRSSKWENLRKLYITC